MNRPQWFHSKSHSGCFAEPTFLEEALDAGGKVGASDESGAKREKDGGRRQTQRNTLRVFVAPSLDRPARVPRLEPPCPPPDTVGAT
jgi:hypothetical protein